jgi:transcriptional regulator with XRE-family HTH domain
MDFNIIKQADLTQQQFADLCGVSRVTVNLWVSGKMNPHRLIAERVDHVMSTLTKLVESKELPSKSNLRSSYAIVLESLSSATTQAD